jgi:hypothetical protein
LPHTVSYSLSLLDKSPIPEGETPPRRWQRTVALAQRAERWATIATGWPSTTATAATPVRRPKCWPRTCWPRPRASASGRAASCCSTTARSRWPRVSLLASLAPGRVDLGIGKAPGGLPLDQQGAAVAARPAEEAGPTSPAASPSSTPSCTTAIADADHRWPARRHARTHRSCRSASCSAPAPRARCWRRSLGWAFVYAGHFNGDPAHRASFDAYRSATGRAPLLALFAFAAETAREGRAAGRGAAQLQGAPADTGQSVNLGSLEAAAEFARQAGVTDYRTEERRPHVIAGTADAVRARTRCADRAPRHREFVIDIPVAGFAERGLGRTAGQGARTRAGLSPFFPPASKEPSP